MMHKIIGLFTTALISILLCTTIQGQEMSPIQTDRPDQTETPAIVPVNHFQLESGFNYEQINKGESKLVIPTLLWKYGLNKHLELRLITEYNHYRYPVSSAGGITPVKVGFKAKLTDEKGIIPATSFIGHLSLSTLASQELKAVYVAPLFRFTMQHTLSKNVSLGYNLGAEWDGDTPEPAFIYTLTTSFALSAKWGSYIELYGFAPQQSRADHRYDGGITYLLKNNILIDVSGGAGISSNAPSWYGSLGFSVRLPD